MPDVSSGFSMESPRYFHVPPLRQDSNLILILCFSWDGQQLRFLLRVFQHSIVSSTWFLRAFPTLTQFCVSVKDLKTAFLNILSFSIFLIFSHALFSSCSGIAKLYLLTHQADKRSVYWYCLFWYHLCVVSLLYPNFTARLNNFMVTLLVK